MRHRRLTHTASSARPSQTPLQGCADDAAPLTPNTVALPGEEAIFGVSPYADSARVDESSRRHISNGTGAA